MRIGFLSHLDLNLYLFRLPVMAELARLGHTVFAIAPAGRKTGEFARHGVTAVTFPMWRGNLNPLTEWHTLRSLIAVVTPLKLDLLHSFMARSNFLGALAVRRAGIPRFICSVTGLGSYFIADGAKAIAVRAVIRRLMKFSLKRAEKVVFQNSCDLNEFITMGLVEREKTAIIKGSGIDTDLWKPDESRRRGQPKIIMVARTLAHKGVREYADAAFRLKSDFPEAEFLYVGGADPANVSNLPADFFARHPQISWLGEREDIRELMQGSDIFALPSYREGLPRTVIEAESCGLPVVTTDVPGCRDSIAPEVTGFLVPPRDSQALALALAKLLGDKALRRRMGEAAREYAVREFDIRGIVGQYLKAYGIK